MIFTIETLTKKAYLVHIIILFLLLIFIPFASSSQSFPICPPEKYKQGDTLIANRAIIPRLDSIQQTNPPDSILDRVARQQNMVGDFSSAIANFTYLLSRSKTKNDSSYHYLGRAYAEQHCSPDLSYNDCLMSIKLNPKYGGYWLRAFLQNNDTAELNDMNTHINLLGLENVRYMDIFARGKIRFRLKDYTGAEADMDTVLKREPLWGEAYNYKTKINEAIGKVDCNVIAEAIYAGHPEYETLLKERCPSLSYKKFVWAKWRKFCSTLTKDELKKMKADMKFSKRKERKGL